MMLQWVKRISITCALLAMSAVALAQDGLASAKAQGQVGERPDGLVALVAGGTPELQALVARVNEQRLAEYRGIATDTASPLEAVQARAGRQIIDRLPAGQYFMDASGRWRQK
jgi:uncharacterized protein YdbL (DUF1318 family)